MYAGFTWNRSSVVDMIGESTDSDISSGDSVSFDPSIVRDVLFMFLFPSHRMDIPASKLHAVMDLITGSTIVDELTLSGVDRHSDSGGGSPRTMDPMKGDTSAIPANNLERIASDMNMGQSVNTIKPSMTSIASAERVVWNLLTSPDAQGHCPIPGREDMTVCLKLYRKLIQAAEWKASNFGKKTDEPSGSLLGFMVLPIANNGNQSSHEKIPSIVLEIEELFCTLNLLSAVSKAIVLAHKSYAKKLLVGGTPADSSVFASDEVLGALAVGTRSDIANTILECLRSFSELWRRRFDDRLLRALQKSNSLLTGLSHSSPSEEKAKHDELIAAMKLSNVQYLRQCGPVVPGTLLFKLLTRNIPLPNSVHDFIRRLFM